jgi:hypothetical protein
MSPDPYRRALTSQPLGGGRGGVGPGSPRGPCNPGPQLRGALTIAPPPPVGHCDTPTCTIRHCNNSPHKRFHIETIQPHRGRTVRPHPNRSVRPLRSGSNVGCDNPPHEQSDPFSASPGGLRDSSGDDTQMALRHPRALHPRMGQLGASLT